LFKEQKNITFLVIPMDYCASITIAKKGYTCCRTLLDSKVKKCFTTYSWYIIPATEVQGFVARCRNDRGDVLLLAIIVSILGTIDKNMLPSYGFQESLILIFLDLASLIFYAIYF
jgi:hypothetical protein